MRYRGQRRALREIEQLRPALQTPMAGVGSRRVSVFSPQATKTTTLAMVLWVLAESRGDQVLGVDANPDKGKLRMRLCAPAAALPAYGLSDLLARVQVDAALPVEERVLRTAAALQPVLEQTPARMLRLISNAAALPEVVARHRVEHYRAALDLLSDWFAVIGIDIGRSQTGPATSAALTVADHLLVPWEADGTAMNLVLEAQADLVRFGHSALVADCTMVVTAQDSASNPDTALRHLQRYADQRERLGQVPLWRHVVTIPYDEAAGSVGQILWDDLGVPARLAYTQVAARVAESFARPPLSRPHTNDHRWYGAGPNGPLVRPAPGGVVRQLRSSAEKPPPTADDRGLG